ncbi:MAG: hypothetical protein HC937_04060 [Aquincola sp.]|nr:hypothetical protein [Aquincola sp.]
MPINITFRTQLIGSVSEFCSDCGLSLFAKALNLVELIVALAGKTVTALKKELSTVGVGLLGEMLGKVDVDEDDDVDDILTTQDAIRLAGELGTSMARRLRQRLASDREQPLLSPAR